MALPPFRAVVGFAARTRGGNSLFGDCTLARVQGFVTGSARALQTWNYDQEHPAMKKNNLKKLTLSKETLRGLDTEKLAEVAGGDPSNKYTNCGSCGIACTAISCATC
jgi:hypothetical protein